jgi:hypothetical protein
LHVQLHAANGVEGTKRSRTMSANLASFVGWLTILSILVTKPFILTSFYILMTIAPSL